MTETPETETCHHPRIPLCGGEHPGGYCPICAPPDEGFSTFGPWLQSDEDIGQVATCYRSWGVFPFAMVCPRCGELVLGPSLEPAR
jgi:hypothetical protein